jgi:hypothetical protein
MSDVVENLASRKNKYLLHIGEFRNFSGSAREYCRAHDLSASMFSYYKRCLMSKRKPISSFAKVKVEAVSEVKKISSARPAAEVDPEWLARLIHSLVKMR